MIGCVATVAGEGSRLKTEMIKVLTIVHVFEE